MEIWQKNALENIHAVLKEMRMSQVAYAKKANIDKNHLNAVLKAKKPLTRQFVSTFAANTGRDTDWFYLDHSIPVYTTNYDEHLAKAVAEKVVLGLKAEIPNAQLASPSAEYESEENAKLRERIQSLEAQLEKLARLEEIYSAEGIELLLTAGAVDAGAMLTVIDPTFVHPSHRAKTNAAISAPSLNASLHKKRK